MSFLSVFTNVLHAAEAAAKIAAPIVAVIYPVEGALLLQAADAAVGVEALLPAPGTGAQKAAVVRAQTQATVDIINGLLGAQGRPPLPANVTDVVQQQVEVLVAGLNGIQQAVGPNPAVAPTPPKA